MATQAEKGIGGTTQTAERGVGGTYQAPQQTQATSTPVASSGGGGGGSYGSSGGGGSSTPNLAKDTQAQINNTAGMYQKRADDLNKQGQQQLQNIQGQIDANNSLFAQQKKQINTSVQWQPNQQKEQSTLMALRNRMGNSAYGSSIQDLVEGMSRVDDMNDVQLIETYKENMNKANDNWYQANSALVSDYNDAVIGLQDEFSKLYSQYWSTLSNINPQLASASNLNKSAAGKTVTTKKAKAVTKAEKALAKAQKAYNKKSSKSNKKALTKAKKAVKSAKKSDPYYTLPATNLAANAALSALMKTLEPGEAPAAMGYIRPDMGQARGGDLNTSYAANSGFADNLAAFRRNV